MSICGSLITISQSQHFSLVTFAHLSIKEFITSPAILSSPVASFYVDPSKVSLELGETCIQYLSFFDFASPCRLGGNQWEKRITSYPFLTYAAFNWLRHLAHYNITDELVAKRLERRLKWFLQPNHDGYHYTSWQQLLQSLDHLWRFSLRCTLAFCLARNTY